MHVAAVGDIHDERASSVPAATAAEAAKADFILGLGDYQYDDGAMAKYNSYFDKDWGPNVPKMYPVLAPSHDQFWKNADPLKYFNGGGAHGYKSPITLQPYTPYSFDKGSWHFIALSNPGLISWLPIMSILFCRLTIIFTSALHLKTPLVRLTRMALKPLWSALGAGT